LIFVSSERSRRIIKENKKIEKVIVIKALCLYLLFFFACPKKNQKRAPANNYTQFAGTAM
jgi:hypothetical protein